MNAIKILLEKYWLAETTLEEEKVLVNYFRGQDVDAELLPYASFFEYIEEEKKVSPGEGFEERILERVGLAAGSAGVVDRSGQAVGAPAREMEGARLFSMGYAAAAALLLCICSLYLIVRLSNGGADAIKTVPGPGRMTSPGPRPQAAVAIKDTYEDPEKALAAVRRALLVASAHMNEGKSITQKNLYRLNNSWQAATGN